MTRPRVALLNAAHDSTHTTRNFRRELDAELVEFHAVSEELPEDTDYDGVVVSGSRASVYYDEAWIDPLVDYVADVHDAGVPCWASASATRSSPPRWVATWRRWASTRSATARSR